MVAHKSSAQQVTGESPAQHRHLSLIATRPQRPEPRCSPRRARLPCTGHAASGVRPAQATSPFGFKRHQGLSARSHVTHLDEPVYPAQATLPQESDQLKLHRHLALNSTKASTPGATLLTLTSPSTLHRPRCLRNQTSSSPFGFKRHQGLSDRSHVAHLDEPIYPTQATLPQESDQLIAIWL